MEDAERREQEAQVLCSIFCEEGEFEVVSTNEWRLRLTPAAYMEMHLPVDYPSTSAPLPVLYASLDVATLEHFAAELLGLFDPGNECIYQWHEHLRNRLVPLLETEDALSALATHDSVGHPGSASGEPGSISELAISDEFVFMPNTHHYGQRTRRFDAASAAAENQVEIVTGTPHTPPGKSTFQAHFARVESQEQVQYALRYLLQDKKIARATHNIFAYRFWDEQRGVQVSDNDDDGENAAGGRLATLLELMHVNNVIVVVSRWYGGIHLGPDRFKYISNAARQILEEQGFGNKQRQDGRGKRTAKR
mmetsp:Transcript_30761/g.66097  ORF Transcript_30761/g.66097 Transcript_30761/m.66097 type:complete len:307 (-) Transcript_30761:187-1107(-)